MRVDKKVLTLASGGWAWWGIGNPRDGGVHGPESSKWSRVGEVEPIYEANIGGLELGMDRPP